MRLIHAMACTAVVLLPAAPAPQLTAATRTAFDRYVALTEARMSGELSGAAPFLWIDRQPAAERTRLMAQLRAGEVATARLETRDAGAVIDAGDGLLHHWIGTVFLPGATMDRTMAFVQDYNRYAEHFAPMIQRSRIVNRSGDRFVVAMRTRMKKVIEVVIDADYTIDYRMVGPGKMYTKSVAANVHEVASPGTPGEQRHPADARDSYMWRLNTYCSFEQRTEGVYEQCESISLTRNIPWVARWIVRPFVTSIPREALEATLGTVRAKVK